MPICTYACARCIASLMLLFAIVFAWSNEVYARTRIHGNESKHGRHLSDRHHGRNHRVPLPPNRPKPHSVDPPLPLFNPTDGKSDICLAMNAYFETNKVTTKEAMFMVAFVNKHRADEARANDDMRLSFVGPLDKFVDMTATLHDHAVCLATYRAWAFSWTMKSVCKWCQKWIRLQSVPDEDDPRWLLAQEMAKRVEEGWGPQHMGLDPELSRATYYFNPDATRRVTACRYFYGPLVRLIRGKRIGGHEFYAVPTPEEQKKLHEVHSLVEKIQVGVTKRGRPKWKIVRHSCDIVDALPFQYEKAFNP